MKLNDNVCVGGQHGYSNVHSFVAILMEFLVMHNDPVVLDDCQFHESANLEQFEMDRSISLTATQGEFALLNYRCMSNIRPPFKVYTTIQQDDSSPFKVTVRQFEFLICRKGFGECSNRVRNSER